jgi:hypothetical protein
MKQKKHRRARGMLTSMVKYPKGASHKKEPLWRRIGMWAAAVVAGAVLLVVVVGLTLMMFKPDLGIVTKEGDFEVVNVEESSQDFSPEERAVAAALISIEGRWVRVPLREDNRAGVEKRKTLHVRYTLSPRMGVLRVESFSLVKK